MSYNLQQTNDIRDQMQNLSGETSEFGETSGVVSSNSSENCSSAQGAIKKSNQNKKPKEKYYKNNYRRSQNDSHFQRNNTASEWRPFQFQNRNGYASPHNSNSEEVVNFRSDLKGNKKNIKTSSHKFYDNNVHNYRNANVYKNYYKQSVQFGRNVYDNGSNRQDPDNQSASISFNVDHKSKGQDKCQQFHKYKSSKHNDRNWRYSYSRDEKSAKKVDIASQRERLEEMIKLRTLECLVCCEVFKHNDKVWNCKQCYHILHLRCIQAWANSSKVENGWRCPACQNVCKDVPKEYRCFCEKVKDPKNEPGLVPHSCGDVCLREGRNCEHRCLILCHPGPCPDCFVIVKKHCGCGKTEQRVKCCSDVEIVCQNSCEKLLECGLHKCNDKCHEGICKPCDKTLKQICFCEKEHREVKCNAEYKGKQNYSCQSSCGKILRCGNHKCQEICHDGPCIPCKKDVAVINTCFCGKSPLSATRVSCLDPIVSCGMVCQKFLTCGPTSAPHICKSLCHDGDCPPCDLTTVLKCRCGFMDKEMSCQQLTTKADDARCERKCTKKRLCGKHKCNQRCCIQIDHVCPLPCNHLLSCGNHRCDLTCHSGRCKPCIETSFEELYCECGSSVLYPPVPCGTKPPVCDKPCGRRRNCGHDVNHTCHTGACPPCTILCKRWCYGNHEQRSTIPCHQENFSCGLPCGKNMPCGRHKCNKPCHLGLCPVPCKQPCSFERSACGHPCNAPCHQPPCPETNCKSKVAVACLCGIQKGVRYCNEVIDEFRNFKMAQLRQEMTNMSMNGEMDISFLGRMKRPDVLKILECTEECRVTERNRRLAIGLQIRNPDISQKLTPRYSDFMRNWAKKDPHFCQRVHNKLTELVQLAKQSKQKSRSYSFESMNKDKRHFIHEYCEHFGCESAAYDAEPNRNIVATAIKDKSWLPSMSLLEVIQRENGQRKVPGPSVLDRNISSKSDSIALKSLGRTVKLGPQVNDIPLKK
ncbi:hypothetical protein WA026_008028 [Henosepilachna vigintioctopunctata]|uniref:Protein shuttle craft n=1 Tax=Henosepilachna vigintioctopunctata TaxID=420089 RepID=A0AAW1TJN4_9CUCU